MKQTQEPSSSMGKHKRAFRFGGQKLRLKITKKAKAENSVAVYTAKIHEMVAPAVPDDDEDLYDD